MNPHAVRILDYSAPVPPELLQWEPEGIPNSAGINDIVRLLLQFRTFVRGKRAELKREVTTLAAVNDENVGFLLRLAYRASFQTDEGRPIRTRVAVRRDARWWADAAIGRCPEQGVFITPHTTFSTLLAGWDAHMEDEQHHAYRFQEPRLLKDPKLLVKLAPLLPERDGVVAVREIDATLCVTGMGLLDQDDADRDLLHQPSVWQPSAGLIVEILGPGHLRVVEGEATFVLAADRLVTRRRVLDLPQVERWLTELSRGWIEAFRSDRSFIQSVPLLRPDELPDCLGNGPHLDVYLALARILRSAVSLGHGGAFAVLPDVGAAPLSLAYSVNPVDLGAELLGTWRAHCTIWNSGRDAKADHLGAAEGKRVAANRWLRRLFSVGQLAAADGCVVFDRRLVLHGFGGSIQKNGHDIAPGVCRDLTTGMDVPAAELVNRLRLGERHRSALALCRQVPNAIVFVISQDGDLRVFVSDAEGRVFFASNLSV